MFKTIAILGPGLLGASLMQAARQHELCQRTIAWSRRPETRIRCEQQPWCDSVMPTASEAAANADLVVICTPVETIAPLIHDISTSLKPGTLVTDVGSTKSLICRQAHAATPSKVHFVGSHPMAGSEKTGMENASASLFQQRACFVTPLLDTDPAACDTIVRFWTKIGMGVTTTTPEKHDEIVANISHLPHILASTLCSYLATQDPSWLQYAGGGLRDSTRIAAGDPQLWHSIITQNREEILQALSGFEQEIDRLRAAMHNNNTFDIMHTLTRGKQYRDRIVE